MNWLKWGVLGIVVVTAVGLGLYFLIVHFTEKPAAVVDPDAPIDTPGTVKVDFVNTSDTALRMQRYAVTPASLLSLQYNLLSVSLYEDLKVSGTAWSPSDDPAKQATLTLYSSDQNVSEEAYLAYGFTEALADTTNYVDMVDPEAVASQLSFSLTIDESTDGKSFQWVVVGWMRPIKFRAEFIDQQGDGTTKLYSKTASNCPSFDGRNFSVMDSLMSEPEAELTTIVLNNGGYFTRLAEPIVIDSTKAYRVLFGFNPDGVLKAANNPGGPTILSSDDNFAAYADIRGSAGDSEGNHAYVPMLPLAPIVYAEGEKIFKESYMLHFLGSLVAGSGPSVSPPEDFTQRNFDILLEIYYRDSAPDNVAAATSMVHLTATSYLTASVQPAMPNIFFYEKDADTGLMNFRPYDQNYKLIHGFTRKESGTCSLYLFQGLGGVQVEMADQVEVTVEYEYLSPDVQII